MTAMICTTCKTAFDGPRRKTVSAIIFGSIGFVIVVASAIGGAVLLAVLGAIPLIEFKRRWWPVPTCPACKGKVCIPADSPAGKELSR